MKDDDYKDDDNDPPDEIRSPQEVARRALALFSVWGLTSNAARQDVLDWLDESNLREELTPNERKFVENEHPTAQQQTYFSWHCERLIVLLWTLNLVDELPPADEQCDTAVFTDYLPPFADVSAEEFISNAILRSDDVLWNEADRMLDLHWQARDAKLNNREPKDPVDIEIIQERHHAINWVTDYCGLDWDDVTTDT